MLGKTSILSKEPPNPYDQAASSPKPIFLKAGRPKKFITTLCRPAWSCFVRQLDTIRRQRPFNGITDVFSKDVPADNTDIGRRLLDGPALFLRKPYLCRPAACVRRFMLFLHNS